MSLLYTILAFLLALGPLIVLHELGHYLVARACGVKVLRFSVGMGRVVWSRRFGKDQNVVFLHTGGQAGLFGYPEAFGLPGDVAA